MKNLLHRFRDLVSLAVLCLFVGLTLSGAAMYFLDYQQAVTTIHLAFAFIFPLLILVHLLNNLKPIQNYLKGKRNHSFTRRRLPLFLALFLSGLLVAGGFQGWAPFAALFHWSREVKTARANVDEHFLSYELHTSNLEGQGLQFSLEAKKGGHFHAPMVAVWLEDENGQYLQTLYVSESIGSSIFGWRNGEYNPGVVRRPEGLPHWSHARGERAADGFFAPDPENPVADGYTGATPEGSFILDTRGDGALPERVMLKFEVNQSYDWNDYYSKDRFPDDAVYSGSGQVGQPAVVYGAWIDTGMANQIARLQPLGHAHHSGETGELYSDLSRITTALDIFDRIVVTW